jgi:hypothetical protein
MNKIRISLGGNEIELEGTDEFIDKHLKAFYDRIGKAVVPRPSTDSKREPSAPEVVTKKPEEKTRKIGKKTAKTKSSHTMLSELNLKPDGKQSFYDFVKTKNPSSDITKCVVSVYYIERLLGEAVSTDHVYTCFKTMGWRIPSNLDNKLYQISSVKGWLMTSDMSNIKVTAKGENLVDHDLPKKKESK